VKLELEHYLWERVTRWAPGNLSLLPGRRYPREVIAEMRAKDMIASKKQAWATLEKWCDTGGYDYGVSLDLGWLYGDAVFPRQAELDRALAIRGTPAALDLACRP